MNNEYKSTSLGGKMDTEKEIKTILLVEDEILVRTYCAIVLESAGYKVIDAKNGKEAIELVNNCNENIDLLITNIVLPGECGKELANTLRKQFPDIKVLYISGYNYDIISKYGITEEMPILKKPFVPTELLKRVREILDA